MPGAWWTHGLRLLARRSDVSLARADASAAWLEAMRKGLLGARRHGVTLAIGHTGFFGNRRVVDVCGVIDPSVAHREVANLGRGKAGHEKMATLDHVLAQRPTFVIDGYLPGDLWGHG